MSEAQAHIPVQNDNGKNERSPSIDETSQLYEKLKPVHQLFANLGESGLDSPGFSRLLFEKILEVMQADLLVLFRWNQETEDWEHIFHHGIPKHLIKDERLPRAWQSLPTIVQQEGTDLFSDDIAKERQFIGQIIRGLNFHSFAGTTIHSGENIHGSLSIAYQDTEALDASDRTAFLLLSNLIAPFLHCPPVEETSVQTEKRATLSASIDLNNRILSCNLLFSDLLGYEQDQLPQKSFSKLLTGKSRSTYLKSVQQLRQSDQELPSFMLEVNRQKGKKRTLLTSLSLIKMEDAPNYIELTAEDVTEISSLEKDLLCKEVLLEISKRPSFHLGDSIDETDVLKETIEEVFTLLANDGGILFRLDEKKQQLVLVYHQGLPAERTEQLQKQGIQKGDHILWRIVEKKSPIQLSSKSKESPLQKRQVGEEGMLSYEAVPIQSEDCLWGILVFFSQKKTIPEVEMNRLSSIGKALGQVIDRVRFFREIQQQIENLTTLSQASHTITKSLHLEQVLASISSTLKRMIGASNGYIFLGDDKRHFLSGVAASEQQNDAIRKFEYKMNGDFLVSLTARERHPFVIENAPHDARVDKKWMKIFKSRSLLSIPIISKDRLIGVILLDECRYFRKFSEGEIKKVVAITGQISVAIENAILHHSVSRHRDRLQTLSSAIVNIQEEERRRISRKLRVDAGKTFSLLQKDLKWLEEKIEAPSDEMKEQLSKMQTQIEATFDTLKTLSNDLRPPMLDESGLLETVKSHIQEFESQNESKVHLQTSGLPKRFSARIEILFFRIIQESLANIAKHASAESVIIALEKRDPYIHLHVTDDGKGFDVKRYFSSPLVIRKGIGILGMKERIELAGGTFYIDSNPGQGTRISIRVPIVKRNP
ncbi:MAG: GAF domain-containing protein [Nitrospiria bacterium]